MHIWTFHFRPLLACMLLISFSKKLQAQQPQTYPRIVGYVGVLHPIVSFSSEKPHYNFDGSYTGGLPTGINIWKSAKIGFSAEFVPFIRSEKGASKMNNFLFHPGALFGLGKGYTLAARAAFETSGRYGFTPVLNKIVAKANGYNWFIAVPVPARFGNNQPSSIGIGFQFGIVF
ncbi:hypothetical protein [Foetidibacter luteolus]|uniref:hypothetical protein n=1 Tax=Foetidibacter luteolus TaxID=2608880 RepID=UPI001A998460|nr:hypothetical protein [Foetidibacter luteolus]